MTYKQLLPAIGWDAVMNNVRIPVACFALVDGDNGSRIVGLVPDGGCGLIAAEDVTDTFSGYLHETEVLAHDA